MHYRRENVMMLFHWKTACGNTGSFPQCVFYMHADLRTRRMAFLKPCLAPRAWL